MSTFYPSYIPGTLNLSQRFSRLKLTLKWNEKKKTWIAENQHSTNQPTKPNICAVYGHCGFHFLRSSDDDELNRTREKKKHWNNRKMSLMVQAKLTGRGNVNITSYKCIAHSMRESHGRFFLFHFNRNLSGQCFRCNTSFLISHAI